MPAQLITRPTRDTIVITGPSKRKPRRRQPAKNS
jgi:hypothetical protein